MANDNNLRPFNKGHDPRRGTKPKGSKHVATHIRELLETEDFKLSNGFKLNDTPINVIIRALIEKAVRGDLRAADLLFKHGYGHRLELDVREKTAPELTTNQLEQLLVLELERRKNEKQS